MSLLFTESEILNEPTTPVQTHEIVHDLTIGAGPAEVFDALGMLAGHQAPTPIRHGQELTLTFSDGEVRMRVELAERPEIVLLACTDGPRDWLGTSVALRIEPVPREIRSGDHPVTMVRFWHGGWAYSDGQFPRASFEWALRLDRLRRHLDASNAN
jgi:hypothetical protein